MRRPKLTDDQVKELVGMYLAGDSLAACSLAFDRAVPTLRRYLLQQDIVLRPPGRPKTKMDPIPEPIEPEALLVDEGTTVPEDAPEAPPGCVNPPVRKIWEF
jgi:hypothetical protein